MNAHSLRSAAEANCAADAAGAHGGNRTALRRATFVLVVGALFAGGILAEIDGFNGPWYWRWPWRDLGFVHVFVTLAPSFLSLAVALWLIERKTPTPAPARIGTVVALLVATNYALQLLALLCNPRGFEFLHAIVVSPYATSYFGDAQAIGHLGEWLRAFHSARLGMHSATHPPGPILWYYAWLNALGPSASPLAGGLAIGAVAALGVATMAAFARLWTDDVRTRLYAAALYALMPALIVFLPEFDQVYPIFTMLAIMAWVKAVAGSPWHAVLLGCTLAAGSFFAYNLLSIGAFFALHAAWLAWRERFDASTMRRIALAGFIACATAAAMYVALWSATGFDPLRSVAHAIHEQNTLLAGLDRPWWAGVIFAPYDFLLGGGLLAGALLLVFAWRLAKRERAEALSISLIGLATIAVIDASGLLRAETARIWLFLQPLVIVPAAVELARLGRVRVAVLMMQWLIVVVLVCKLVFISA